MCSLSLSPPSPPLSGLPSEDDMHSSRCLTGPQPATIGSTASKWPLLGGQRLLWTPRPPSPPSASQPYLDWNWYIQNH